MYEALIIAGTVAVSGTIGFLVGVSIHRVRERRRLHAELRMARLIDELRASAPTTAVDGAEQQGAAGPLHWRSTTAP